MNKVIYKYELGLGDSEIDMPAGAQILTVHQQNNVVTLWALVDPSKEPVKRSFLVVGTGKFFTCEPHYVFIGTVFVFNGTIVFHVFNTTQK